jgi:hypothetical protein
MAVAASAVDADDERRPGAAEYKAARHMVSGEPGGAKVNLCDARPPSICGPARFWATG